MDCPYENTRMTQDTSAKIPISSQISQKNPTVERSLYDGNP